MVMAAAVSVTLVSLLGVAAITGVLPSSHGTAAPAEAVAGVTTEPVILGGGPARYVTADGKILEVVQSTRQTVPVAQIDDAPRSYAPAAPVHRHPVRHSTQHYAQNSYSQPPVSTYQQPYNAPQQHPVVNYVNDMHPVGTGVGAVVGGLLGNQVGGGNGKKLATVAGVLMGGYAGNEIAHNRSPLPGQ